MNTCTVSCRLSARVIPVVLSCACDQSAGTFFWKDIIRLNKRLGQWFFCTCCFERLPARGVNPNMLAMPSGTLLLAALENSRLCGDGRGSVAAAQRTCTATACITAADM